MLIIASTPPLNNASLQESIINILQISIKTGKLPFLFVGICLTLEGEKKKHLRRLTTLWNSIESFSRKIFCRKFIAESKNRKKMYGPELVFDIFNLNRSMFLHFWVKICRKCILRNTIHYSKANKAIDLSFCIKSRLDIILHKCGKIDYIWCRKLSKYQSFF